MSPLLDELDGAASVLRLNRPAARNALNVELVTALRDTLDVLAAADSVCAVVLTGSGKASCAGLDLEDLETTGATSSWAGAARRHPHFRTQAHHDRRLAGLGLAPTGTE